MLPRTLAEQSQGTRAEMLHRTEHSAIDASSSGAVVLPQLPWAVEWHAFYVFGFWAPIITPLSPKKFKSDHAMQLSSTLRLDGGIAERLKSR